ncbi:hypothetical protein BH10BAC5_BH10BAC5_20910 [soil metagenome]
MKKFILCTVISIILAFSGKGFCENGCSVMHLTSLSSGTSGLVITNPYTNSPETVFAGAVNAVVDGNTGKVYCIDLNHGVSVPSGNFNDSGYAPSKTSYILTNYYPNVGFPYAGSLPDVNREAAAIQLAIWHFMDGVDPNSLVGNADIKARLLAIIADADLNAGTFHPVDPLSIIAVSLVNNCNVNDTIKAKVVDINGNGVVGKVLSVTVSVGGSVSSASVTTGAGGFTPPIVVTKGGPHTTVTITGSVTFPSGVRFVAISAPLNTQQMGLASQTSGCITRSITLECDTTSSVGGAGVETNYNMAEALFKRHSLIEAGEITPIISNNNGTMSPGYTLSQLAPNPGPFNSLRVENTPFDILGISNATSAFGADYKVGTTRVGEIFSTTTNAPEIYSHSKPACDRLAKMNLNMLEVKSIDGHEFYLAELFNPAKNYTDYTIIFSVYENASNFTIDNKWTIAEYNVPAGTLGVYNYQIWAASPEAAIELTRSVLAKFAGFKTVNYPTTSLNNPNVFIKSSSYTNDGKIRLTIKNGFSSTQSVPFTFKYTPQVGSPEQTVTQNISASAGESNVTLNLGFMSSSQVTMTQSNGFKDAVFIGGGVYGSYAGSSSRIDLFQNLVTTNPVLGTNSFVFPGGIRMKGLLGDKVYIGRTLDGSAEPIDLRNFLKLRFEIMGTGTMTVVLEAKINGVSKYPVVTVPMTSSMTLKEIPLSNFTVSGAPVDLTNIVAVYFQMDKGLNASISNFDYTVQNAGIIRNPLGIGTDPMSVSTYALTQNFPNPFNPTTRINYTIPSAGLVSLKVYDNLGREVKTLVNEIKNIGEYNVTFDASSLPSGIYFYKLVSGSFIDTKKMLLVK